jgi:hypothetical protein
MIRPTRQLQQDYDSIHEDWLRLSTQRADLRQALREIAALTTNDEHSCYDTLALIQKMAEAAIQNT